MASNMNVSVTLQLRDQFTGPVRQLLQQFQQLTNAAQAFNRAAGGTGSSSGLGRLQQQVRAVAGDVRQLAQGFAQLGRSVGAPSGGGLVQSQVAGMRTLLGLQAQAIANNNRLASGGGGGGRGPGAPGGAPSWWGRRGFSPNASLMDRAQYRGVNFLEQSLSEAVLEPDIARTRLRRLDVSPEIMRLAEDTATSYARVFPELTRGAVMSTLAEILPQFRADEDAFRALPYLLRVQQLDIQAGRRGREGLMGMLDLVKATGMTGRLMDAEGNFTESEASNVLDAYLRLREIEGIDINPAGFRQLIKYMKANSQTLSVPAIMEMAFLAPDVGFSSLGTQMTQFVRGFASSRATKMALEAQAKWGLRTAEIDPNHPEGPGRLRAGALVDSELMRENPSEWVRRHILGPQGVLRRMGIQPMRATPAAIADALAPLNSNTNAENILLILTQMQSEIRTKLERAARLNRGQSMFEMEGPLDDAAAQGMWANLQTVRSRIIDAMTAISDNLTDIVIPPLKGFAGLLEKVANWTSPQSNPIGGLGVMLAGAAGGFMLLRRILGGLNPWLRTAIGGGAGLALGGVEGALMGGLMARGMGATGVGGAAATAAAGVAGAAAGRAWVSRFAGAVWRFGRSMTLWGLAGSALTGIVTNWETIRTRLVAIFGEIKQAAPTFLWGEGKGMGAFGTNPNGVAALGGDATAYARSWRDWLYGPVEGALFSSGSLSDYFKKQVAGELPPLSFRETGEMARVIEAIQRDTTTGSNTINMAPFTVNVHVGGSNADPNTIGEAAGNAIGSKLRGLLADTPEGLSRAAGR